MSILRHQVCIYTARLRSQYDRMGRRVGNWRGREENIWTSMSLPYRVTNVGQFTNPIIPNATDDAAVYGLLRQYAFGTGIEPTSKMDVRLLRNFRAVVTHRCSRLKFRFAVRRVFPYSRHPGGTPLSRSH